MGKGKAQAGSSAQPKTTIASRTRSNQQGAQQVRQALQDESQAVNTAMDALLNSWESYKAHQAEALADGDDLQSSMNLLDEFRDELAAAVAQIAPASTQAAAEQHESETGTGQAPMPTGTPGSSSVLTIDQALGSTLQDMTKAWTSTAASLATIVNNIGAQGRGPSTPAQAPGRGQRHEFPKSEVLTLDGDFWLWKLTWDAYVELLKSSGVEATDAYLLLILKQYALSPEVKKLLHSRFKAGDLPPGKSPLTFALDYLCSNVKGSCARSAKQSFDTAKQAPTESPGRFYLVLQEMQRTVNASSLPETVVPKIKDSQVWQKWRLNLLPDIRRVLDQWDLQSVPAGPCTKPFSVMMEEATRIWNSKDHQPFQSSLRPPLPVSAEANLSFDEPDAHGEEESLEAWEAAEMSQMYGELSPHGKSKCCTALGLPASTRVMVPLCRHLAAAKASALRNGAVVVVPDWQRPGQYHAELMALKNSASKMVKIPGKEVTQHGRPSRRHEYDFIGLWIPTAVVAEAQLDLVGTYTIEMTEADISLSGSHDHDWAYTPLVPATAEVEVLERAVPSDHAPAELIKDVWLAQGADEHKPWQPCVLFFDTGSQCNLISHTAALRIKASNPDVPTAAAHMRVKGVAGSTVMREKLCLFLKKDKQSAPVGVWFLVSPEDHHRWDCLVGLPFLHQVGWACDGRHLTLGSRIWKTHEHVHVPVAPIAALGVLACDASMPPASAIQSMLASGQALSVAAVEQQTRPPQTLPSGGALSRKDYIPQWEPPATGPHAEAFVAQHLWCPLDPPSRDVILDWCGADGPTQWEQIVEEHEAALAGQLLTYHDCILMDEELAAQAQHEPPDHSVHALDDTSDGEFSPSADVEKEMDALLVKSDAGLFPVPQAPGLLECIEVFESSPNEEISDEDLQALCPSPRVQDLLREFPEICHPIGAEALWQLPEVPEGEKFQIHLVDNAVPKRIPPFSIPPVYEDWARGLYRRREQMGWITPSSNNPWGSPVFFKKKKQGPPRELLNYVYLNSQTVVDRFPLERIDRLLRVVLPHTLRGTQPDDAVASNAQGPSSLSGPQPTAIITQWSQSPSKTCSPTAPPCSRPSTCRADTIECGCTPTLKRLGP